MVGLLDKLRINIIEQNLRLEEEIKKIEEEAPNSTEQEINDFIITYNKTGRIDVEKLKLFFDKLDVQNLETIEWYGYAQSLLDYYEKTKISTSSAFSRDINKAQEMIERLIIEINKLREKLFSNIKNVSFRKKELEKNILYLEKIEKLIDNYETSKFMSEDNCDFLFTYLSENKIISEEELCELIKNIVLTNSKILEETIRLETLKRKQALEQERILREQQLKEQKEKELANQAKKEQELIYLEPTPKEKVEISDEYLATFLGESQIRRYNLALSLISNLNNISEKTEVISKTITEKSSWKERLAIYESLTLPEEKMELVLYDLKVNILPKIEQQLKMRNFDKKLFSLLKEVLTYYERLQSALQQDIKKEAPKDYIFYLNLAGKTSELEMCNSVDALINSLLELQKTYPEFYNQIKSFISNLKDKKDCYTQSVELFYYDKNDDDSLLMELYYEEMKSSYDELNSIYNKFMYSIENNQEILLGLSDDFYKNARDLKNIIVFCNDDGEIISDVEKDILEERKFTTSIYGDIIKRLQDNVSEDLVAHGNHKVKNNKYYSEEFLKKYHVKSIQNGESRTFYSVFNTNLGPLFGGSNIKVMFVYLVGYGKNTNTKIDINYKALKRCYDDRRNIDYYVELFNTDWSSLSNQEFIQKRGEVFEYLKRQNIKLGHLIKSYNNRLKLEQGRGPKND